MAVTRLEIQDALEELGVNPDTTWGQIRASYRQKIRAVHPDVVDSHTATSETARLNSAFEILVKATDSGRIPLPERESMKPVSYALELAVYNADVFHQFVAAAHNLGEVTYISRDDGLVNVLLGQGTEQSAELLIVLEVDAVPVTALFTLESDDQSMAPDISSVVTRFQKSLSIEFGNI